MAEILENDLPVAKGGPAQLYPWDEWLDGKPRRLRRGEDFACQVNSMRASFSKRAQKRGLFAVTAVEEDDEDTLLVQVVGKRR